MSSEKEFSEGSIAYALDVAYNDCPYPIGTHEWNRWCSGWLNAQHAYHVFTQTGVSSHE